jgi:TonB family protein
MDSRATRAAVLGYLLFCACVAAIAGPVDDPDLSFDQARSLLAKDPRAAAATLDQLARSGHGRAQMLLGVILIEGKRVPQDRPLGMAFLQVAATQADWYDGQSVDQIQALTRRYQLEMPGDELIEADRLAGDITIELDKLLLVDLRPALLRYTDQALVRVRPGISFGSEPVQLAQPPPDATGQSMRLGCVLERRSGCDGAPAVGEANHCTGRLFNADAPATARGPGVRVNPPEYSDAMRRSGRQGTVSILTHVDSSGWICSALVARSAGDKRLDAAALEAVRQWRLLPAKKAGNAVESLKYLNVTFHLF